MRAPQISLLMPLRNAKPFLKTCIESILAQDFKHWELIAVDDHSTDDSAAFLKKWQKKDSRIHLLPNRESGIIPALQLALEHSRGTFISRMDSDDLMPIGRLSAWMQAFELDAQPRILTGLVRYFSTETVSGGYRRYERWLNSVTQKNLHQEERFRECGLASPNWLMPRSLLEANGGFGALRYPEDYHLYLRWTQAGIPIQCLDQVTLFWREHPGRTSRNSTHYQQAAFFALKLDFWRKYIYQADDKVFLLGAGRKTRLSKKCLQHSQTPFETLRPSHAGSEKIKPQDWQKLVDATKAKVLISIYPSRPQRENIQEALENLGLRAGESFWFL